MGELTSQNKIDKLEKYLLYGGVIFAVVSISFVFGMLIWGLNMLNDSMNKTIDAGMESQFIGQAYEQGFTESDQVSPHCFYHKYNLPEHPSGLVITSKSFGYCPKGVIP
jgi:hypothetical protein